MSCLMALKSSICSQLPNLYLQPSSLLNPGHDYPTTQLTAPLGVRKASQTRHVPNCTQDLPSVSTLALSSVVPISVYGSSIPLHQNPWGHLRLLLFSHTPHPVHQQHCAGFSLSLWPESNHFLAHLTAAWCLDYRKSLHTLVGIPAFPLSPRHPIFNQQPK